MPIRSPESVSVPEESLRESRGRFGRRWLALTVSLGAVAAIWGLARWMQPAVDAALFGLEASDTAIRQGLSLWVGQLGVVILVYLLTKLPAMARKDASRSELFTLLEQLLRFLILLSWLVVLYIGSLELRNANDAPLTSSLDVELLLVASIAAVLGPICFRLWPLAATGWRLALLNLIIFYAALIALEPDQLLIRLVQLGVVEPPMDWMLRSSFLGPLQYLAPLGAVLWSTFGRKSD